MEDFNWFGQNRDPLEDYVSYRVFVPEAINDQDKLQKEMISLNDRFHDLTHRHVWQYQGMVFDAFDVSLGCISGRTIFGDCLDDEWLITYLLKELTEEMPGYIVQMNDMDGEYLLIECAEYLPSWIQPHNSQNRVFLMHGQMHLIPLLDQKSSTSKVKGRRPLSHEMEILHSLQILRDGCSMTKTTTDTTLAPQKIQKVLNDKLSMYSTFIATNVHKARIVVPLDVAHVLKEAPELVSPIVRAFYYREPKKASQICSRMKHFPPKDNVETVVRFSRCLYAQMKQQEFFPPKPFIGVMPPEPTLLAQKTKCSRSSSSYGIVGDCQDGKDNQDNKNNEDYHQVKEDYNAYAMGMKFTCGLEILYASSDSLEEAKQCKQKIDKVMKMPRSLSDFPKLGREAGASDSWLEIEPEGLEALLQKAQQSLTVHDESESNEDGEDDVNMRSKLGDGGKYMHVKTNAKQLSSITELMNQFLSSTSGLEGAESFQEERRKKVQQHANEPDEMGNKGDHSKTSNVHLDCDALLNLLRKGRDCDDELNASDDDDDASDYYSEEDSDEDEDAYENDSVEDDDLESYMRQMDSELSQTSMQKSFARFQEILKEEEKEDTEETKEEDTCETTVFGKEEAFSSSVSSSAMDDAQVNVDFNLVSNFLDSVASQEGLSGPVSNMLSEFGFTQPSKSTSKEPTKPKQQQRGQSTSTFSMSPP